MAVRRWKSALVVGCAVAAAGLLVDDSASSLPAVSCARPAARGVDLTFGVDPATVPNGFMADVFGATTAGTITPGQ